MSKTTKKAGAIVEGLEVRQLMASDPPAPFIDGGGMLRVAGTNKGDVIVLSRDDSDTQAPKLLVTLNRAVHSFPAAAVTGGVVVDGGNGKDDIRVSEQGGAFTAPVTLHGGNGKDTLVGGSGDDKLYGDNGKDTLRGLGGADLLDGGRGRDTLTGGPGADRFSGADKASELVDRSAAAGDTFDSSPGRGKKK